MHEFNPGLRSFIGKFANSAQCPSKCTLSTLNTPTPHSPRKTYNTWVGLSTLPCNWFASSSLCIHITTQLLQICIKSCLECNWCIFYVTLRETKVVYCLSKRHRGYSRMWIILSMYTNNSEPLRVTDNYNYSSFMCFSILTDLFIIINTTLTRHWQSATYLWGSVNPFCPEILKYSPEIYHCSKIEAPYCSHTNR